MGTSTSIPWTLSTCSAGVVQSSLGAVGLCLHAAGSSSLAIAARVCKSQRCLRAASLKNGAVRTEAPHFSPDSLHLLSLCHLQLLCQSPPLAVRRCSSSRCFDKCFRHHVTETPSPQTPGLCQKY